MRDLLECKGGEALPPFKFKKQQQQQQNSPNKQHHI
jgi:hypothetical protein